MLTINRSSIKRGILYSIFFIFIFNSETFSQTNLTRLTRKNLMTETDVFVDPSGTKYSDLITIKFDTRAIDLQQDKKEAKYTDISNSLLSIKDYLKTLESKYGEIKLQKVIPDAVWGDTLRVNKRTKGTVTVPDFSQLFTLHFAQLVPVDSIAKQLKKLPGVKYAHGPREIYLFTQPNDSIYARNEQWGLARIQAPSAWEITTGLPSVKIAIHDSWSRYNNWGREITYLHNDLNGKVLRYEIGPDGRGYFSGHGTEVGGAAGASTNNGLGVSSLGWNVSLLFYSNSLMNFKQAVNDGVDVINMSWGGPNDYGEWREAISSALAQGIVCVSAAGNADFSRPFVDYPAAYNFGGIGQVIAVSAVRDSLSSDFPDMRDHFDADYSNWSVGNNPATDPTNSFIDVAAPGTGIVTTVDDRFYGFVSGTSFASPFVSALAGLIVSLNNTLTPTQVYEIITHTTDTVWVPPDAQFINGWNKYTGYGRINAYKALQYVVNHYGTTREQIPTPPTLLTPTDSATNISTSPKFTWKTPKRATSCSIEVSTDRNFLSPILTQAGIINSSFQANGLALNTIYYWRVSATNSAGTSHSSVFQFTTWSVAPPPVELVSPANGTNNYSIVPTLIWRRAEGATEYRIQVSTNSSFTTFVFNEGSITDTSRNIGTIVPSLLANNTLYYWRVIPSDSTGERTSSNNWSFITVNRPTLNLPINGALNVPVLPTFNWNSLPGATSYRLQVADYSDFRNLIGLVDLSQTSYTATGGSGYNQIPTLIANTQYFWRINANIAGGNSGWSQAWSFTTTLAAPLLSSPANGTMGVTTSPTLTWNASSGATSYRLQVSTDSSFTNIAFNDSAITSTSRQVNSLAYNIIYYWRVSATNAAGSSQFSSVWSFTTLAPPLPPVLASPANGTTDIVLSPTLSWNASSGAANYRLQVSTDSSFTNIVFNDSTIMGTSRQISSLGYNTKYYWRVNAKNAAGTSTWSSVWSFTTVPSVPSVPTLNSPANGATSVVISPTLSWNPSNGATSYRLQISTDSLFSSFVVNDSTITGTSRQVGPLAYNTRHYWRVNAKNTGGTCNWSSVWSFTTEPLRYYLTVNSPCGLLTSGSGWYIAGTTANPCVTSTTVSGGTGIQYVFTNWTGDGTGTNPCITIVMDGPKTITANCKTQYLLTVNSPCGFPTSGTGWYDSGTTAPPCVTSTMVSGGTGIRYVFTNWSGDATGSTTCVSVLMNAPKTLTANCNTQYELVINNPCGLPVSGAGWYNAGQTATLNASNSVNSDIQYVFTSWSGDATGTTTPINVLMNGPKTVTANCQTLYLLTVNSSCGLSTSGQGWYYAGSTANACVTSTTVSGGTGIQYVFTNWSGAIASTITCVSITMNAPKTVTANCKTQYYLTMNAGTGGTVSPSSGWYDAGQNVGISATANGGYVFSVWTGSGTGSYSGASAFASVNMLGPITETATFGVNTVRVTVATNPPSLIVTVNGSTSTAPVTVIWPYATGLSLSTYSPQGNAGTQYVFSGWSDGGTQSHDVYPTNNSTYTASFGTQYQLTASAGTGGSVSPTSSWYNNGAYATASASANAGYSFNFWSGDASGSSPTVSVLMNGPKSVTANFCQNRGGPSWAAASIKQIDFIDVSWGDATGSCAFSGFRVYRKSWVEVNWIQVGAFGAGSGSFRDWPLSYQTGYNYYDYRIDAVDGTGAVLGSATVTGMMQSNGA